MKIICSHCGKSLVVKQHGGTMDVLTMEQFIMAQEKKEKEQREKETMAKKKADLNAAIRENESFWSSMIGKLFIPAYVVVLFVGFPFVTIFLVNHMPIDGASWGRVMIDMSGGVALMGFDMFFTAATTSFIISKYSKKRREKYFDSHPDSRRIWNQILVYENQYEVDL